MNDYSSLDETGYDVQQPLSPEEEFFHSVYIAGQTRTNHINIEEQAGKLQIRGVAYNLDKICMIVTHVKPVLLKSTRGPAGRETVECFSFRKGEPPWFGWNKRQCGSNSAERAANDFCQSCRAQLVVTGIYCDEGGKPILSGEDNKPAFVFLRGKGMKYKNVADYLAELAKKELTPIITPVTEETKKWEQRNVNNKRFVTIVSIGEASSNYGPKKVFTLTEGMQLTDKVTVDILNIAKKTVEQFTKKFDWSKEPATVSGYGESQGEKAVDPAHTLPDSAPQEQPKTENTENKPQEAFDFDNLEI